MGGLFGVPGMLWWGLAASIPILIHLFARQRFRKIEWAAMDFLLRAFKKTRKRIRLEHLLLLLLRILAILLFVLALAEPLVKTSGLFAAGDTRREVVILLDDSFSMGLKQTDGTSAFLRARDQAARITRSLRSERGDSVTLVTVGKPANLLLKGSDDLERAATEIERLEVGDGATDYLGAFTIAVAALDDLRPGAEIFLLSDLQRVAFAPPSEAGEHGTKDDGRPQQILAAMIQQIRAKKATLFVVAPADAPTDNLAVVGLEPIDKAAIAGIPLRVAATVKNFGARPQRGVVHLFADGGAQPVDVRELDAIPPGGTAVADFRTTFAMPGSHTVEARFLTDALGVDNRRGLAIEVRDRLRTLVVDGDPKSEPGESESFFLSSVLDPGIEGGRAVFAVEVTEETRFDSVDLGNVDLLVLMNVGLLSRKRSEEIQRFVEGGGGLLVYLGDRVQAATMNSQLWKGGSGVLPAELLETVGDGPRADVPYTIVNADLEHPALAYFDDPEIRTWLMRPPVYRFIRTRVGAEQKDVHVLASFDRMQAALPKTEAAIIEKTLGKGRTILITTSGDQDWTDIPAFPTNVLLVRELSYYLTRRAARLENLVVGQSYQRILKSFAQEVVLSRDGEQLQVLRPLAIGDTKTWELKTPDLAKAGIYKLDLALQPDGQRKEPSPIYVAMNVDTAESDLARVGQDYLGGSFPGDGVRWLDDLGEAAKADGPASDARAWWWTLLAGLVVMLTETALSQIFGLRSRGGAE